MHALLRDTPRTGHFGKICPKLQSGLGNRLAACQQCLLDTLYISAEPKEPPQPQLKNLMYFEENVCEGWLLLQPQGKFTSGSGNGLVQ